MLPSAVWRCRPGICKVICNKNSGWIAEGRQEFTFPMDGRTWLENTVLWWLNASKSHFLLAMSHIYTQKKISQDPPFAAFSSDFRSLKESYGPLCSKRGQPVPLKFCLSGFINLAPESLKHLKRSEKLFIPSEVKPPLINVSSVKKERDAMQKREEIGWAEGSDWGQLKQFFFKETPAPSTHWYAQSGSHHSKHFLHVSNSLITHLKFCFCPLFLFSQVYPDIRVRLWPDLAADRGFL